MLINCPKCHITYNIDATAVPQGGRKLHCTNCDEIFWCNPEDLEEPTRLLTEEEKNAPQQPITRENPAMQASELNNAIFAKKESESDMSFEEKPEVFVEESLAETDENLNLTGDANQEHESSDDEAIAENHSDELNNPEGSAESSETPSASDNVTDEKSQTEQDIQDIFQRISVQNEQIKKLEHEMGVFRRGCKIVCNTLGFESTLTRWMFGILLVVFIVLGLYTARYEITRKLPWAEQIFNAAGIESKIVGEGLKFSNVSRREFEIDDINHMEIRGFIDNETAYKLEVPKLHVEILDEDGEIIQKQEEVLFIREIAPGDRKPFKIDIQKPSILGKYIYITFVK